MSDEAPSPNQFFGKEAGEERFINFAEMMLEVQLTQVQEEILRKVHNNKRLVVVSGNGVGKTFIIAVLEVAFLYSHRDASVMHTSRSNSQIRNTTYREVRDFVDILTDDYGLPGEAKKMPMEVDFEDSATRGYEAVSPSNPEGLEGRHNDNFLMVVDEADKPEIDGGVIDAANSTLTDDNDRMVVVGNPPRTKSNTLYELMESEHWETVQFSSFDSDNVRIQAGEMDGELISGPVRLEEIKRHWEKLHDEPWPGYEEAKNSGDREDLAESWYRRRLGQIPPNNALEKRPFYSSDVDEATDNWDDEYSQESLSPAEYDAIGVDVAGRGGDSSVAVGLTDERVDILGEWNCDTETENENMIRGAISGADETPIVFDTGGLGGPVADSFRKEGFNVVRFDSSKHAENDEMYYNQRAEAYGEFGNWMAEGGAVKPQTDLARELYGISESMTFDEKSLRSGTTWIATSKDELKKTDNLGKSPDFADSVVMAAWGKRNAVTHTEGAFSIYSVDTLDR